MIKISTVFIFLFSIFNFSLSQSVPDSVFNYTFEQLTASRDSVRIIKEISFNKDSIISTQNKIINNDSILIINQSEIIDVLNKEIKSYSAQNLPFISFKGFYSGISASYQFIDSTLTKYTVINGMEYDLTGNFKFSINGVLDISGTIGIPLRSEKFYLKASLEYRIF